jgi:hypothetical protein
LSDGGDRHSISLIALFFFGANEIAHIYLSVLFIYYLNKMFTTDLNVLLSGAAQHAP